MEVLKNKYPESNTKEATEKGEKATTQLSKNGKNKLEMFRFNPGKIKKILPPNHPYRANRCNGNKLSVSGLIGAPIFFLSAESEKCRANKILEELNKKQFDKRRTDYEALLKSNEKRSVSKSFGGKTIKIKFASEKGRKHFVNDVLFKTNRITKKDLPKIHQYVSESIPQKRVDLYKNRKDNIEQFYYLYDEKRKVYYHIAEEVRRRKNGLIDVKRFLYGVTNSIKKTGDHLA